MAKRNYRRKSKKSQKREGKYLFRTLILGAAAALLFGGYEYHKTGDISQTLQKAEQVWEYAGTEIPASADDIRSWAENAYKGLIEKSQAENAQTGTVSVSMAEIPEYSGEAYVAVENNVPQFTDEERNSAVFEYYSELDDLGRCGVAEAMVCTEIMPTEERGNIGMVKPTGWHTVKYDIVDGKYLYNRCHLIGYQLAGENANVKNLITGTRYLNVTGMLPWENLIAEYVKRTDDKVLYRVTPVYEGDNLVASGVQMEAESLGSDEIRFNVFVFNIQPGIEIDYATGDSRQI